MSPTSHTPKTRFSLLVDTYGSSIDRWPNEDRAFAIEYLTEHPDGQCLLDEARRLDGLLDLMPTGPVSDSLQQAILTQARAQLRVETPSWIQRLWPLGPIWQPATALACLTMLGLAVGWFAPAPETTDNTIEIAQFAFLEYDDWSDEP